MLTVIIIMTSGIITGYLLRNVSWISLPVGKIIMWAIYLLLFLLGISVGTNDLIIRNLYKLGWEALLLTTGGVMGSVVLSFFTYRFFFRQHEK